MSWGIGSEIALILLKIAETWFPNMLMKHQNTSVEISISERSDEGNLWVTSFKYIRCEQFLEEGKSLVILKYHSTPYSELLSNSSHLWLLWKADFLHSLLQEVTIFIHPKKMNSVEVYIYKYLLQATPVESNPICTEVFLVTAVWAFPFSPVVNDSLVLKKKE